MTRTREEILTEMRQHTARTELHEQSIQNSLDALKELGIRRRELLREWATQYDTTINTTNGSDSDTTGGSDSDTGSDK